MLYSKAKTLKNYKSDSVSSRCKTHSQCMFTVFFTKIMANFSRTSVDVSYTPINNLELKSFQKAKVLSCVSFLKRFARNQFLNSKDRPFYNLLIKIKQTQDYKMISVGQNTQFVAF